MELRHLRCFMAVAEELHFARAAERLHIEQSPLSRAIKELEEDLGAQLFVRTTRSTRLTRAGRMFLEHVPRVFACLQQAQDSVKAAANGFHGQLRIAFSDGVTPSCFSALLALCRQEEPEIEIRLSEVPLSQQIKGLHDDLYDVGFAQLDEAGDGLIAEPVWHDSLMVAVPARHPLLAYKHLPLDEVLRYPLALADTNTCEGHARQVERVLRRAPELVRQAARCAGRLAVVHDHATQAPNPGFMREVYYHLAVLSKNMKGNENQATELLRRSGYDSFDSAHGLTTPFAVNKLTGHTFASKRIREIVPHRVYALSGFEFTEYYFIVSSDGKELVAIDAGTRPDSAQAAFEALNRQVRGLPPLTTVFFTPTHWDHVGGHSYFRRANPNVRFYARENYAQELARDINAPAGKQLLLRHSLQHGHDQGLQARCDCQQTRRGGRWRDAIRADSHIRRRDGRCNVYLPSPLSLYYSPAIS